MMDGIDHGAEALLRIEGHELVCTERYKNIDENLQRLDGRSGRLEKLIWTVAGGIILQLVSALAYLITHQVR